MSKKILTTPISAEDIKDLKVGDIVYLTGRMVTCRDVAHRRVIEEGLELPVDVKDKAILHAGPIIAEEEFIDKTGVRIIIGKGGMGEGTARGCKKNKALHLVIPAGNAVWAATRVKEIVDAQWKELGMPETLWVCDVEEFGPLIVSIDSEGNNIFEQNKVIYNESKEEVYKDIINHVHYRLCVYLFLFVDL